MSEVRNVWLVTQRKPLERVVPNRLVRWFLRWVFRQYGFACRDYDGKTYASIEYRGVFEDQAEAMWAAKCEGGSVKPLPLNAALPEETCQYGAGDVPMSEASPFYRRGVLLPFTAMPRTDVENLGLIERKIEQLVRSASA